MRSVVLAALSAVIGAAAATMVLLVAGRLQTPTFDEAVVRQAVRDTLNAEPELVMGALQAIEQRRQATTDAARAAAVAAHRDALYADPATPSVGPADASVTIVEFFDYRCPYCKRVAPDLATLLRNDGDLRIVYKEWPILGPQSVYAAKAALAAQRQGKYREMHEALIGLKGELGEEQVLATAQALGLDVEHLMQDMQDPAIADQLERVRILAEALQIDGTPAFLFGGRFVGGAVSLEQMQELVKAARQQG
jgi:protein-disulfide isomerase